MSHLSKREVCSCIPALAAGPDEIELFAEGDLLYDAMLASIGAAHGRIWLETFIFADDEIGRHFAAALAAKARSGVEVRLLIDAAGSALWFSRRLERYLLTQGVTLHWFHRWRWRDPLRYNRRDHRKLLVIDELC